MCTRKRVLAVLGTVLAVVLAVLAAPGGAAGADTAGPSITTDQPDYAPGSTVTLSGAGWSANEDVVLSVDDNDGQSWHFTDAVTADDTGVFVAQVVLPDWFVATYTARAIGSSGVVATTTFTDSNVQVGAVNPNGKIAVNVLWQTFRKNGTCTGTTLNSGSVTTVLTGTGFTGTTGVGQQTAESIEAATSYVSGGRLYTFDHWSGNLSGTGNPLCVPGDTTNGKISELANYVDSGPTSKLTQTISFALLADKTYGDPDFQVSATASSGLPVSFSASGSCTVSGTTVHLTDVGDCTITATQDGNATYLAATPVPRSFTVNPGSTTVTVTCPSSTIYTGFEQTPCTAVATGAGLNQPLTVSYTNNIVVGTATASASFAGDATHNAASNSTTFSITPASSSILFTCPASVTYTGTALTPCTATVTGDGGLSQGVTVTYSANTNAGTATASASYAGDPNHSGTSNSTTFGIDKAPTTTTVTCSSAVSYTGSAQTPCSASVTGAALATSATVSYTNNTAAGTAGASASYAGDSNHTGSSDSTTFQISTASTLVSITCPTSVTYDGSAQTPCTASVTGSDGLSSTLTVSYSANTNAGTATASASYAGDGNHDSASNSTTFTIDQASSTLTLTCSTGSVYDSTAQTPCTATVTGAALSTTVAVTYTDNVNAGTAGASASYPGDANHAGSSDSTTFDIAKATSTVTVTCTSPVMYDGTPQTPCSAEATGVGNLDDSAPVDYPADVTDAGTIDVSATFDGDGNHFGNTGLGDFVILAADSVTVVTCPPSVTYDGSAQTPCTAAVTGAGNLSASLTVDYSNNTEAGTATATASFAGDANHNPSNDTQHFDIDRAPSTTTVTCSPSSVGYTGAAQTPCTATVTGAALDLSLPVDYTDNTNAGTASASATFGGDADHTGSSGTATFTITKAPSTVTVTCTSPHVYTGFEQTPCSAEVTGVDLSQALTVSYDQNIYVGTATAIASYLGDDNHEPSSNTATFAITKAPTTVTLTCPSQVTFTGSALTPCSATVTGARLSDALSVDYADNVHAGVASASADFAGDANHTGDSDSTTFTIEKADSQTTVSCPVSVTYNASAQTPCTAQTTAAGGLDAHPAVSYTDNTDVGTAHAHADYAGDADHNASSGDGSFQISKAASTTTLSCLGSVVYTGDPQTPCSTSITGPGLSSTTPDSIVYSDNVVVGTASVTATYNGDANHDGSSDTKTFGITPAPTTVTVTCPTSVVYDATSQTPCTATVTGAGGLSHGLSVSYTANVDAGTVTASATYAGDNNHTGNSNAATFDITKAAVTIQVSCAATIVYTGSPLAPCTGQVTGAGGLDTAATIDYQGNDHTNAGTVHALANYAGDDNHTGNSVAFSFVIAQASSTTTLTCTAHVTYTGSALTPCTATATGAGPFSQSLSVNYGSNTNAGTATASASFAGNANHLPSSNNTTFTIDKAPSTVTVTCQPSVPYTSSAQTPCSATATGAGPLSQSLSVSYGNNTNAGTATASASFAGDANHDGNTGSTNFAITKVALTVKPDAKSMTFGDPVPALTYTLLGFVGGENATSAGVTGVPNCSTAATSASPQGSYSITCTPGSLAAANYSFTAGTASLAVSTKAATLGYTGNVFWSTGSTSATSANVTLQATLTPSAGGNPNLALATPITFSLYKSTNLTMTTADATCTSSTVTVTNGTAVANCQLNLGIDNWTVIAHLGTPGSNYFAAADSDPVVLTVYQPTTDIFATGGGWVTDPSGGVSPANKHGNFGFTVRYNKSGSPQGQAVYVFRGTDGYDYVIKSNSWQGGGLSFGTPTSTTSTVAFSGKCNVTVINRATGLQVTGLGGGGYSYRVDATDNGSPGASDTYAISVYSSAGTLYHQAGTTASQLVLGGGNVVVHAK